MDRTIISHLGKFYFSTNPENKLKRTNSNYYFQFNLGLLRCIDIGSSIYHWWLSYQRYSRSIQGWLLASDGNIGKRTCMVRCNCIRTWSHGYWWLVRQRVSLFLRQIFDDWKFFSVNVTEIWNFEEESDMVVNVTQPRGGTYAVGIALYIVPFDFCT